MAFARQRGDAIPEQGLDLGNAPGRSEPPGRGVFFRELLQCRGLDWGLIGCPAIQPVQPSLTTVGEVIGNPVDIEAFHYRIALAILCPMYTWGPRGSKSRLAQ